MLHYSVSVVNRRQVFWTIGIYFMVALPSQTFTFGLISESAERLSWKEKRSAGSCVFAPSRTESPSGPVFVVTGECEDESITLAARSMTTVVRAFLEHVSEHGNDRDSDDEDRDDGDVGVRAYPVPPTGSAWIHAKGPHFFGRRIASISSRLVIRSFPSSDDLSVAREAPCACNDGS